MVDQIPEEQKTTTEQKTPIYKQWWFWLIIFILVSSGYIGMIYTNKPASPPAFSYYF